MSNFAILIQNSTEYNITMRAYNKESIKDLLGTNVSIRKDDIIINVYLLDVSDESVIYEYETKDGDVKTEIMKVGSFLAAINGEEMPIEEPQKEQPAGPVKKESFFESILSLGGCLFHALVAMLILFGLIFIISKCQDHHADNGNRAMSSHTLYKDSIDRAKQEQQEALAKDANVHIEHFYISFNKYYPFFSSCDEFEEWLYRANSAAFELLHSLYSSKYHEFNGPDGVDKMAEYLFWGPPEYETTCEKCGEMVRFSE